MNLKNEKMKKIYLLLSGLLIMALQAFATDITVGTPGGNGGVEVSGTWATGSTVTVYDHIIVPVGSTLTIEEGVNVLIADTSLKIEMIVLGNLYSKGTEANPVNITVKGSLIPSSVPSTRPFPAFWGGIICDTTCTELLMLYTNIKYYGAATTNSSPSVLLDLYKAAAGQTEPYLNFRNHNTGKLVVEHCTFSNGLDDGIYIEGGNVIFAYNTTYQNGSTSGDATNLKAGTIADLCYNLYYSPNTNAFKLSNTGSRTPQCNAVVYNNTIVNAGWRRPTVKGGSIWYESAVIAKTYNTLQINNRFGIKSDGAADTASRADYNFYYGYGQTCVNNFNSSTKGIYTAGAHDIAGTVAGSNDPLLVNYPLNTDTLNSEFDTEWDFHLQTGSPAIGAGTTNFTRHFGTTGITIDGVTYTSPAPSTTIGAFDYISVTSVSVSPKTLNILLTNTASVTATVAPLDASNSSLKWTSSDPSIATVDETGVVTALKIGTTKVYVNTVDGNYSDTCKVTVTAQAVAVTSVSVSPKTLSLQVSDSSTVVATVSPEDATNLSVTWSSTDEGIATVSAKGVVKAVSAGTTNIIVKTEDGSFLDTCVVTVKGSSSTITVTENQIEVYPNPASNNLYISDVQNIASVSIFDITGHLTLSKSNDFSTIDISLLNNGIYLLKINTKNGDTVARKIVKVKD
jgi:uncharacterized protein YjdB